MITCANSIHADAMKTLITLLLFAFTSSASFAATVFTVTFDFVGPPQISGPGGGSTPADFGLNTVRDVSAVSPNSTHVLQGDSGATLWLDQYNSGDFFAFLVSGIDPASRFSLIETEFSIARGPTGPTEFELVFWDLGMRPPTISTGIGVGMNTIMPTGWRMSEFSVAVVRIIGLGGTDDSLPINETFGLESASFTFEVIPEPSSLALIASGLFLFNCRRRHR